MHDIRLVRSDKDAFDAALAKRGAPPAADAILSLDEERRAVQTKMQEGQTRRNEASKAIGKAMGQGDTATAEALKAEVAGLKETLPALEAEEKALSAKQADALAALPNLPADDVPLGADESENVEVSRWGTPRTFDFEPQEHADFAPALGMDFNTGATLSGARFVFLRGQIARLNRALGQMMLDLQVEQGFSECAPPLLVKTEAMYGTGQLPKFADDLYETSSLESFEQIKKRHQAFILEHFDGSELPDVSDLIQKGAEDEYRWRQHFERRWLIPTAEVSLTNSVREAILESKQLPIRLTALTPCFRSEAGAAGKDTRGLIRQHQFDKVELVAITAPDESEAMHEAMCTAAEAVLQALELPYRKVLLCTGDMGFSARKTYDLEVWLPGQNTYREISSISNCGDFQARRMNARYKPEGSKKTEFVHTLNGSGLAVGRTLVAVLENGQNADGSVTLPSALVPYMGGIDKLEPA